VFPSVIRPLLLVALFADWNQLSDVLSDRLGLDAPGFASPWKIPLTALGLVVQFGGIVWLGSVVWGRSSLRGLGWTFASATRLVVEGLALTVVLVGLVYAVYAAMEGAEGVHELTQAIATLPLGRRVFFTVMGARNAFVEETLFRGDLLGALEKRWGKVAGVLLSSVVFALYHRTLTPVPLAMKFVTGALYAVATVRARSLVPAAIGHWLLWAIVADN